MVFVKQVEIWQDRKHQKINKQTNLGQKLKFRNLKGNFTFRTERSGMSSRWGSLGCWLTGVSIWESIWPKSWCPEAYMDLKLTRRDKGFRYINIPTICNLYRNPHCRKKQHLWVIVKAFGLQNDFELKTLTHFPPSRGLDIYRLDRDFFFFLAWREASFSLYLENNQRKFKILSVWLQ